MSCQKEYFICCFKTAAFTAKIIFVYNNNFGDFNFHLFPWQLAGRSSLSAVNKARIHSDMLLHTLLSYVHVY